MAVMDSIGAKSVPRTFRSGDLVTTPVRMLCPHCGKALVAKKERRHFILHKCVNPKCPYYLYNLKKVDKADLKADYGKINISFTISTVSSR